MIENNNDNALSSECYFCSKPATTFEHIPPQSFYAGRSILPKRLIKVPSCEEHNNIKSDDDEFFRNILSMQKDGNLEGRALFDSKTIKSYRGSPTKFKRDFENSIEILFNGQKTAKVEISNSRIQDYFNKMATGLYLYEYKNKYQGAFIINSLSLLESPSDLDVKLAYLDRTQSHVFPKKGAYPDIFYYQSIFDHDEFFGIKMAFFGGIIFYAIKTQP